MAISDEKLLGHLQKFADQISDGQFGLKEVNFVTAGQSMGADGGEETAYEFEAAHIDENPDSDSEDDESNSKEPSSWAEFIVSRFITKALDPEQEGDVPRHILDQCITGMTNAGVEVDLDDVNFTSIEGTIYEIDTAGNRLRRLDRCVYFANFGRGTISSTTSVPMALPRAEELSPDDPFADLELEKTAEATDEVISILGRLGCKGIEE